MPIRRPDHVAVLILLASGTYSPRIPVAVDRSRGCQTVLWLVNVEADFFWWVAEKVVPSTLIRFAGAPPELFNHSSKRARNRVMRLVRMILPLSLRFPAASISTVRHACSECRGGRRAEPDLFRARRSVRHRARRRIRGALDPRRRAQPVRHRRTLAAGSAGRSGRGVARIPGAHGRSAKARNRWNQSRLDTTVRLHWRVRAPAIRKSRPTWTLAGFGEQRPPAHRGLAAAAGCGLAR